MATESLRQIIEEQVRSRGRLHLRGLARSMRKHAEAATERAQDVSLLLRGKFRLLPPKAAGRAEKAPRAGQVFAYYPGCLAEESAREYDASLRRIAAEVDVALAEVDGWTCCGAGVVRELDTPAARGAAESPVVSGCPVCVERLREAAGPGSALHVIELLSRSDLRAKLAAKIQAAGEERPVGSLKVVCYEGCGVSRGGSVPQSPLTPPSPPEGGEGNKPAGAGRTPMEALMELAGAGVREWRGGARRLGPFDVFTERERAFGTLEKIFRDFEKSGADAIVTACPHCHFALDSFQYAIGRRRRRALAVPVLHFTEVLALALNLDDTDRWLARHVTGPFPLVDRLCAEEEKRRAAMRRAAESSAAKERKRREGT